MCQMFAMSTQSWLGWQWHAQSCRPPSLLEPPVVSLSCVMQCCWITAIADLLDLTRGAMVGARPRVGFTGKPQSEHETNYQRRINNP